MCFPDILPQNNFAQMPFLAAVCVGSASTISFVSDEIKRLLRKEVFVYVAAIVVGVSLISVGGALKRMHTTVFWGADAAGETLKDLTHPQERVFLFTFAQGNAVARYARRYVGWPESIEDFKAREKQFGVRYVCIYPGDYLQLLMQQSPKIVSYLQEAYHVKEVGLLENPNRLGYLILEKGKGTKDIKEFLAAVAGRMETKTIYNVWGRLYFVYSVTPTDEPPATDKGSSASPRGKPETK